MDEEIDEPDTTEEEPQLPVPTGRTTPMSDLVAADPFSSLENLTNALLSSGLGEKYLQMVRHAQPVGPDGEWRHDDITVLIKIGEVASRFLTKLNRAGSRRRRAVSESVEDAQKKIEILQAEISARKEKVEAARNAWRSGGVNRRGA